MCILSLIWLLTYYPMPSCLCGPEDFQHSVKNFLNTTILYLTLMFLFYKSEERLSTLCLHSPSCKTSHKSCFLSLNGK